MNSTAQPMASSIRAARSRPSTRVSETTQNAKPCQTTPMASESRVPTTQDEPDPQRDQADLPVAGDELGGAGQHQRHDHQRDGAPETDPGGPVCGRADPAFERPGGSCGRPKGHGRDLSAGEVRVRARQYHQSHRPHRGTTRRGARDQSVERPLSISRLRASRWARRISASRGRDGSRRASRGPGPAPRAGRRPRRSPRTRSTPTPRAAARRRRRSTAGPRPARRSPSRSGRPS